MFLDQIKTQTLPQSSVPFVLQLVDVAAGEKVNFFRTVHKGSLEVKIFFTNTKLILAKFKNRNLVEMQHRIRPPRQSLLGFTWYIEEQLTQGKLL